ncbi:unnamed protein product [Caenorhabditis angaria]|uniref:Uncharacterized protein n=1 Tax=Caenorhabditis angaria TaxID=860376 RepID=A0A9P1N493_9PELO|nr:unnamed protein product [Caenorhabditis angaria]
MKTLLIIATVILVLAEAKVRWLRKCKLSSNIQQGDSVLSSYVKDEFDKTGCQKNVWVPMDRASKCPQLNGAKNQDPPLIESSVQPKLFGFRGSYSAHCEYMVIVVAGRGCKLLSTEDIDFRCKNNTIFYQGRQVTSFVCAEGVYE